MKTSLRSCFAALALGLALLPDALRAAGPSLEVRVSRLDQLVGLTADQKTRVADVFKREDAELQAMPAEQRAGKGMEVRQDSRGRVRALLTPDQQRVYDRTPSGRGGGLTLPTPESKLARLDETVGLSADQKPIALKIFQAEFEGLLTLPPSDRLGKGAVYRQTAEAQVHELLTPDQLDKLTGVRIAAANQGAAELTALTNFLRSSPAIAARVGAVVSVSTGSSSVTETRSSPNSSSPEGSWMSS